MERKLEKVNVGRLSCKLLVSIKVKENLNLKEKLKKYFLYIKSLRTFFQLNKFDANDL